MPNIKSAKKRVSLTAKQNARNSQKKSALRRQLKETYAAIEIKDDSAKEKVAACLTAIDSAKSHGIYHANKSNRDKSRLAKALNNM